MVTRGEALSLGDSLEFSAVVETIAQSLLIAKFVPGFSTAAPPLAGSIGMPALRFMVFTGSAVSSGPACSSASDGCSATNSRLQRPT